MLPCYIMTNLVLTSLFTLKLVFPDQQKTDRPLHSNKRLSSIFAVFLNTFIPKDRHINIIFALFNKKK